MGIFFR